MKKLLLALSIFTLVGCTFVLENLSVKARSNQLDYISTIRRDLFHSCHQLNDI